MGKYKQNHDMCNNTHDYIKDVYDDTKKTIELNIEKNCEDNKNENIIFPNMKLSIVQPPGILSYADVLSSKINKSIDSLSSPGKVNLLSSPGKIKTIPTLFRRDEKILTNPSAKFPVFRNVTESINNKDVGTFIHMDSKLYLYDDEGMEICEKFSTIGNVEVSNCKYIGLDMVYEKILDKVEKNKYPITDQTIYTLCPSYYKKSVDLMIDCQLAISGSSYGIGDFIDNGNDNPLEFGIYSGGNIDPIDVCVKELAEEVGIVPQEREAITKVVQLNDNQGRIIYNLMVSISDCVPYQARPYEDEQFFNDIDNLHEDRRKKIQIVVYGTESEFDEVLGSIQKRRNSKDLETVKALRLIPLDKHPELILEKHF